MLSYQVLDSIFPEETESVCADFAQDIADYWIEISDTSLSIRIEPEEPNSAHPCKALKILA